MAAIHPCGVPAFGTCGHTFLLCRIAAAEISPKSPRRLWPRAQIQCRAEKRNVAYCFFVSSSCGDLQCFIRKFGAKRFKFSLADRAIFPHSPHPSWPATLEDVTVAGGLLMLDLGPRQFTSISCGMVAFCKLAGQANRGNASGASVHQSF